MQISPKYAFNRGQHQDAMPDGLTALKLRFCDDEYVQGFEKVGPVAYAQFLGADDEKELMNHQLFAASLIEQLLKLIHEKTAFPLT